MAIHPCRGCKYFKECGDNMRTVPCNGRETKGRRRADAVSRKSQKAPQGQRH